MRSRSGRRWRSQLAGGSAVEANRAGTFLYLANKGWVVRKRGAGTVVANERIDRNVELTSLYDDLVASGGRRRPVLKAEVSHRRQVAQAAAAERALVMSLERIRLADGEPMALMHNYPPAGLVS